MFQVANPRFITIIAAFNAMRAPACVETVPVRAKLGEVRAGGWEMPQTRQTRLRVLVIVLALDRNRIGVVVTGASFAMRALH